MARIEFLPSARSGLEWFQRYYDTAFTQGRKNGLARYRQAIATLKANPYAGHVWPGFDDVREYSILRTPFTFVYILNDDVISIIDVRDTRSLRTEKLLQDF